MDSFKNTGDDPASIAAVFGASGTIGTAFVTALADSGAFDRVIGFSRSSTPRVDLLDEASIAGAATALAEAGTPRLIIDATGFLHGDGFMPEKSWRDLSADHMAHAFAVNAIGPALLMKHLLPLLPRQGKSAFVTLSAKVGGIADNRFGGWYSYRASKAALNQMVKTASIELARKRPEALCLALHPGTTESPLSDPFAKQGLTVRSPAEAAALMLDVIDRKTAADSGGFFDYSGAALPW
ncbi:MAG: SDR family NAD(P)-dependent oxidoreductase [Alphaproteobacteria bacterium]|nr:SDR family NAD(P)-dependent oxidoreductase [Alphaproteobacteria bacterium]